MTSSSVNIMAGFNFAPTQNDVQLTGQFFRNVVKFITIANIERFSYEIENIFLCQKSVRFGTLLISRECISYFSHFVFRQIAKHFLFKIFNLPINMSWRFNRFIFNVQLEIWITTGSKYFKPGNAKRPIIAVSILHQYVLPNTFFLSCLKFEFYSDLWSTWSLNERTPSIIYWQKMKRREPSLWFGLLLHRRLEEREGEEK
jgi:hypothetical protein